jgi:hypothetical protein
VLADQRGTTSNNGRLPRVLCLTAGVVPADPSGLSVVSVEPVASGSPVGSLAGGSGSPIGSRQEVDVGSPLRIGALQANCAVTRTHATARPEDKERSEAGRLGKGMVHPTAGACAAVKPCVTHDVAVGSAAAADCPTAHAAYATNALTGTESPAGLLRLQGPPAGHFAGT